MSASSQLVHDLVARWVERQPDRPAVRDALTGEELSYRELWSRAGRLAVDLGRAGVLPHDVVAVAQGSSTDLVVTVLGILRAGAAYLALDVMAPADRLAGILSDAGTDLVVVASGDEATSWRAQLPSGLRVLRAPGSGSGSGGESAGAPADSESPVLGLDEDSPAYVAFTSGSTGRPKGVLLPHRGVRRLAVNSVFCTIEPGDRVASFANPAFDATTFEIWNTLVSGATVVVFPRLTEVPMDEWIALVRTEAIDTMLLTTSLFHTVARERPAAFGSLRNLVVGGEQLELASARRVLAADPPGRLINAYGPTEGTVVAAYFDCTLESLAGLERVPVGRAIQETTLMVLDDELRAVPTGEFGELCIGGPGVGLGYLRRPELTAEKFVAHPDCPEGIYRTGDLARVLPGGDIEVSGRRDRQVKLRGFRIELEEIEREAVATGLLDSAFVEKVGEGPSAWLAGFGLPAAETSFSRADLAAELPGRLAARVPSYMSPARWLLLDRLPIGPTGKVDRQALLGLLHAADPAAQAAAPAPDEVRPDGLPLDDLLLDGVRDLWQQVLEAPSLPPHVNFIEMGGNSMLAMRIAAQVLERFGRTVDAADVLLSDSLAEFAALVAQAEHARAY